MDVKKKVDDVYKTEFDGRKKRVIVGLSGGVDSLVTAYLLKIQKYDLIGVTIVPSWDLYQGDQSASLSCLIPKDKLEAIGEFCHQINIPHMIVKASNEFQEEVVEGWTASRITGNLPRPCWSCHNLRIRLLHAKMLELGADTIATGHFAKLYLNEKSKTVSVHSSNDEIYDQSTILSRLPTNILSSLMLPLSDLQKKEVLKLAENFGLQVFEKKIKIYQCFPNSDGNIQYLESKIPEKFKPPGDILDKDGPNKLGDHMGAFKFVYGQPVESIGQRNNRLFLTKYSLVDKSITVETEESFKKNKIVLVGCITPEDTSWPEPMKAYIRFEIDSYAECWVYPKSLRSAYIEWEEPRHILEGDIVAIFKKKGKNAKVFFTGKVRYLPPDTELDLETEEKNVQNLDYTRDF